MIVSLTACETIIIILQMEWNRKPMLLEIFGSIHCCGPCKKPYFADPSGEYSVVAAVGTLLYTIKPAANKITPPVVVAMYHLLSLIFF